MWAGHVDPEVGPVVAIGAPAVGDGGLPAESAGTAWGRLCDEDAGLGVRDWEDDIVLSHIVALAQTERIDVTRDDLAVA